jgi:RNA polymerase sigma factor (sigma-70 family)
MAPPGDADLLHTIAQGGPGAWPALETLVRGHRKALLGFLIGRGLPRADAEDVVQDVFVRVAEKAGSFRGESQVSSWLHSIARNLHLDRVRAAAREQTLDEAQWQGLEDSAAMVASDDPAAAIDQRAYADCIGRHYGQFAQRHPAMADALHKFTGLGWTSADLALALGRTDAATRQFLVSCRKTLGLMLLPCRELARAVLRD